MLTSNKKGSLAISIVLVLLKHLFWDDAFTVCFAACSVFSKPVSDFQIVECGSKIDANPISLLDVISCATY